MAYTPGPWKWDGVDLWHFGDGYECNDPHSFTGVTLDKSLLDSDVLKANMTLIAAAPELLEALEATIEWIGSSWPNVDSLDWEDWRQTVSKIVAKAKGAARDA